MAKDLRLDVVTTSDGKGLLETAVEADRAAKEVDKLGTQMKETAVDSGILAAELEATKLKMKELGTEFDRTGDKTLLKQINSTRRYSSSLERLQKDIENAGAVAVKEGEKVGSDLGKSIESGVEDSFDLPTFVPVLIGALTSPGTYGLLAQAGAMMGGAVLAGIGTVGIGTGIALSINSPQVQSSIGRLKADVSTGLHDAASAFVTPLSGAVDALDSEFQRLQPDIRATLADIAPEVTALGDGVAGFVDQLVPAFDRAIQASKPLLDALAADMPEIGATLAGLFNAISDNAGVAQQGLQEIVTGLKDVITFGTGVVVIMSDLTRASDEFYYTVGNMAEHAVAGMADIADAAHLPDQGLENLDAKLKGVRDQLQANSQIAGGATLIASNYASTIRITASNVDYLSTELLNFNTQLDAMNGRLDRTEALNNLTIGMADFVKQLKDSKGAFDANTVAGAQNENSYIRLIKQAEQYRQTLIDSHVPQAQADLMFQNWVKDLDAAAAKAGWTTTQIAALNAQLGITAAMKPINVKVNVTTAYSSSGQRPSLGHNIPFLASGGHFDPGPIVVGEHGPELLIPDSAGTIIPNPGSGGGGRAPAAVMSAPTVVQLQAAPGDRVAEALLSLLRPVIRGPYGGDVTAALAGNR